MSLDHVIADFKHRLLHASADKQTCWARRLVIAKGQRGDYALVTQPMSDATIEALAREEIVRMQASPDLQHKLKWARVLTDARRQRRELAASAAPVRHESGAKIIGAILVSSSGEVLADRSDPLPHRGEPAPAAPTAGDRYSGLDGVALLFAEHVARREAMDKPGERHDQEDING